MSGNITTETFSDGTLSGRGHVDDAGVKNGTWEFYYRSGSVKGTGSYADGAMDGTWVWTREDGSLMRTGSFHAGEQRGEWRTYDRAGVVVKTTNFG
jgi:antitoxin component YwqK of YwqJK toxin-antitoxin module